MALEIDGYPNNERTR